MHQLFYSSKILKNSFCSLKKAIAKKEVCLRFVNSVVQSFANLFTKAFVINVEFVHRTLGLKFFNEVFFDKPHQFMLENREWVADAFQNYASLLSFQLNIDYDTKTDGNVYTSLNLV